MRSLWTLLSQPDESQLNARIPLLPVEILRAGHLLLASELPLATTVDGKAVGAWDGVVLNDLQAAEPLVGRGAPIVDGASLVVHAVGWSGLAGLGALRWHGTLAVVHQAQRTAILARDWQGVGGLYFAADGAGVAFSNDCEGILRAGLQPRLVPPGMVAICAPTGVRWQPIPTAADGRAWFRDLPDELSAPTPDIWHAGLFERLRMAIAACKRVYPTIAMETPSDAAGQWLAVNFPTQHDLPPDALWALDGADAWLGRSPALPLDVLPGPWPLPEPPEPLRVDDREALARRVRATWLPDVALERTRVKAHRLNLPIVAPHLDPAVLAWLGAMPPVLRPNSPRTLPVDSDSGGTSRS